jgi:hypothetical protein
VSISARLSHSKFAQSCGAVHKKPKAIYLRAFAFFASFLKKDSKIAWESLKYNCFSMSPVFSLDAANFPLLESSKVLENEASGNSNRRFIKILDILSEIFRHLKFAIHFE